MAGGHQLGASFQGLREGHPGDADGKSAAARHGVAGIDGEIDDDLVELSRVNPHHAEIAGVLHDQLNVLSDQAPQQVGHVGERLGGVQQYRFQGLLT